MRTGAIISLFIRVGGAGTTYLFVFFMAKVMSISDFGVLGTVIAASMLLSMVGSVGQYTALVKFVPPLLAQGRDASARGLIRHSLAIAQKGNLILAFALAAALAAAWQFGAVDDPVPYLFAIPIIWLTAVFDFQAYLLRSYRMIVLALVPKDIAWRAATLLIVGVIVWHSAADVSIERTFVIMLVTGVGLIAGTWMAARWFAPLPSIKDIARAELEDDVVAEWKEANVPLWLNAVSSLAFSNVDVLIVGAVIGPEAAALYFAANRIALAPNFFLHSYLVVAGPILAEHYGTGNLEEVGRMARKAGVEVFIPTAASCVLLAAMGPWILAAFGPEFGDALTLLWILLAAALAQTVFGIADVVLNMCGGEKPAMRICIETVVIGTILLVLCAAVWGATGVAWGLLGIVIWRRYLFWKAAERHLGVKVDVVSAMRTYRAA